MTVRLAQDHAGSTKISGHTRRYGRPIITKTLDEPAKKFMRRTVHQGGDAAGVPASGQAGRWQWRRSPIRRRSPACTAHCSSAGREPAIRPGCSHVRLIKREPRSTAGKDTVSFPHEEQQLHVAAISGGAMVVGKRMLMPIIVTPPTKHRRWSKCLLRLATMPAGIPAESP